MLEKEKIMDPVTKKYTCWLCESEFSPVDMTSIMCPTCMHEEKILEKALDYCLKYKVGRAKVRGRLVKATAQAHLDSKGELCASCGDDSGGNRLCDACMLRIVNVLR